MPSYMVRMKGQNHSSSMSPSRMEDEVGWCICSQTDEQHEPMAGSGGVVSSEVPGTDLPEVQLCLMQDISFTWGGYSCTREMGPPAHRVPETNFLLNEILPSSESLLGNWDCLLQEVCWAPASLGKVGCWALGSWAGRARARMAAKALKVNPRARGSLAQGCWVRQICSVHTLGGGGLLAANLAQ